MPNTAAQTVFRDGKHVCDWNSGLKIDLFESAFWCCGGDLFFVFSGFGAKQIYVNGKSVPAVILHGTDCLAIEPNRSVRNGMAGSGYFRGHEYGIGHYSSTENGPGFCEDVDKKDSAPIGAESRSLCFGG